MLSIKEMLGKGFAIDPTDNKVAAPFDCKVETVFETKHAIGLSCGKLVKKAGEFTSSITITKNTKKADAKKLFAIMSLGVKMGDTINIEISGDDEDKAFTGIEEFIKGNL